MFRIICKSVPHLKHSCCRTSLTPKIHTVQLTHLISSAEVAQKSISKDENQDSFPVSYFMNKCGFSLEKAVSASKLVNFGKPDKPDAVMSFFKDQGFTETQVRKLIGCIPTLLSCDIEKTLLPKIEFFRSRGASSADLAVILSGDITILQRSLENHIKPSFNFFKEFLGSDQDVLVALKGYARLLARFQTHVQPKIVILQEAGLPHSNIAYLLRHRPFSFVKRTDRFKECVDRVKNLGLDPTRSTFTVAIWVLNSISRSTWDSKMEVYKRWGCSEGEVLATFKIYPWCMMVSEQKIEGVMRFFVNEMGRESSLVLKKYYMLTLNLNTRIIPRWSVYRVLLSKGLVHKTDVGASIFRMKEDLFLEKFVRCFKKKAPGLLKLYRQKLKSSK